MLSLFPISCICSDFLFHCKCIQHSKIRQLVHLWQGEIKKVVFGGAVCCIEFSGLAGAAVRILHMRYCTFSSMVRFTISSQGLHFCQIWDGGLYCNGTWKLQFAKCCYARYCWKYEREKKDSLCCRELKMYQAGATGRQTGKSNEIWWDCLKEQCQGTWQLIPDFLNVFSRTQLFQFCSEKNYSKWCCKELNSELCMQVSQEKSAFAF